MLRLAGLLTIALGVAACGAQQLKTQPLPGVPQQSRPAEQQAVDFVSPQQVSVAAGRPSTIDLHFRVANGLHINSHDPHEKTLIPTRLAVDDEGEVKVTAVDFPPGTDYSFAFAPKQKVSVYTGDFLLHAHLTAPAGEHELQGLLRYQACDVNACMPPQSIPIALNVVAK